MRIDTHETAAGDGQLIVTYVSADSGSGLDLSSLVGHAGADAARRQADGWRLESLATVPLRQMGTAGNILFQSGGQFATQVAVMAVFIRGVAENNS